MGSVSVSGFISKTVEEYVHYLELGSKPYNSFLESSSFNLTDCSGVYTHNILRTVMDTLGFYLNESFKVTDGSTIVRSWVGKNRLDLKLNLINMYKLEEDEVGSVKLLYEEYGISEFKRYPTDILLEQFRAHGKDVPYGIILYPRSDYADAFDQDSEKVLPSLHQQTTGKFTNRIFEVSNRNDIGRVIVSLRQRYFKNKISYAIVGGHGLQDLIEFGDWAVNGHISVKDVRAI